MTNLLPVRGFTAFASFALIAVTAATAGAQPAPLRVVQTGGGDLYVMQDGNAFDLVPDSISDSDIAARNASGEVKGAVVTESGVPARVVQDRTGTLHPVVGDSIWTLVPEQISDSALTSHNFAGEIHGTFDAPALQVPAPAAPAAEVAPPAAAPPSGSQTGRGCSPGGALPGNAQDMQRQVICSNWFLHLGAPNLHDNYVYETVGLLQGRGFLLFTCERGAINGDQNAGVFRVPAWDGRPSETAPMPP